MQRTSRLITITLIASMAIGGVALGMEGNPSYNTGEALKKLWDSTTNKVPETSLGDYQKSQKDTQKLQLEKQKQEIYTWYETQKKQIQSDAEAARKALQEKISSLSETEKAGQKDALYAQYKQIGIDAEAKMKDLHAQKEAKMKALESQYLGTKTTEEKAKNELYAVLEAKKKELNTWFETQNKKLMASLEEQKAYLYSTRNALSEEEKKTQKATFEEKKKSVMSEFEAKKKALQTEMEAKMKELKSQYSSNDSVKDKDSTSSSEKEKMRDLMKEKLAQLQGEKKTNTGDLAQCKTTYDTLRTAKEANTKERKAAWDKFWEANKGTKKDIFAADDREDVRDTLDTMRLQIRLVERKYVKSLVGTSSTVTLEYALSTIDTIAQRTRTDLAEYVQDGKTTQFNTFRDGFISVLNTNKKSLLTLLQLQSQTIKGLAEPCKKKAQSTLLVQDQSDRQTQGQLNSNLNGTSVREGGREEKKMPPQSDTTKSGEKESSTQ